jgi:serine/threonine-protein phosphatase 2A regulatory subunit B
MVLFERAQADKKKVAASSKAGAASTSAPVEYKFFTEFQSHEPEFDYLKSLEIEEKINKIRWCARQNSAHFLLSTNDKTVKLWKVYEKKVKQVAGYNLGASGSAPSSSMALKVPKVSVTDCIVTATPKRVFSNAHAYHINSISANTDGETFLSADDLRINIWSLSHSDRTFNVVDIKPENMEELTEVITAAEFHPLHCNYFTYSSSRGSIKLADTRTNALCDNHAKIFEEAEDPANKSFFSEIISSISDVKFSHDGRYIVSRDYLTLKVWDIHQESRPVKTIQIQDFLRSKLCDLYESDCIFDKFEACFSPDGNSMVTGGYHNLFYVFDKNGKNDVCIEASKNVPAKNKKPAKTTFGKSSSSKKGSLGPDIAVDQIDFEKKVLHLTWHPTQNILAVATLNNLYLFSGM